MVRFVSIQIGSRMAHIRIGIQRLGLPVGVGDPELPVFVVIHDLEICGRSHVARPDDWRAVDISAVVNPFGSGEPAPVIPYEYDVRTRNLLQIADNPRTIHTGFG